MGNFRIEKMGNYKLVLTKKLHLPDGILVFPDLKQIAIEVELTMKSKKRLEDILWGYQFHKQINEAWYYCSPDDAIKVTKIAENMEWIKIYVL